MTSSGRNTHHENHVRDHIYRSFVASCHLYVDAVQPTIEYMVAGVIDLHHASGSMATANVRYFVGNAHHSQNDDPEMNSEFDQLVMRNDRGVPSPRTELDVMRRGHLEVAMIPPRPRSKSMNRISRSAWQLALLVHVVRCCRGSFGNSGCTDDRFQVTR